jgi:3',5'-cyclic AMP phosphodiesterase CpdA
MILFMFAWFLRQTARFRASSNLALDDSQVVLDHAFLVQPYIQLGEKFDGARPTLQLIWHTTMSAVTWRVVYKARSAWAWQEAKREPSKDIIVDGVVEHSQIAFTLDRLKLGEYFDYRITFNEERVFSASGLAPVAPGAPYRFAFAADLVDENLAARHTAFRIYNLFPSLIVFGGDLVYLKGRLTEYLRYFFRVFNTREPSQIGVPLLGTFPSVAAPGNHDTGLPKDEVSWDLETTPDLLAYFLFWRQPKGPTLSKQSMRQFSAVKKKKRKRLRKLLGSDFMSRTNFCFRFGNSTWVILDGNAYMDWTNPDLLQWLETTLFQAQSSNWIFVAFHQPPFTTDLVYATEQRMRLLAPIFQKHHVTLVFSGHCHFYQRTHPLRYTLTDGAIDEFGQVAGEMECDTTFDGVDVTKTALPIYIVSGAGGQLVDGKHYPSEADFVAKTICHCYSFTVCDVEAGRVLLRQINSCDGRVLDSVVIEK